MVRFSPGAGLLHVRPGLVLLVAGDAVVRRSVLELLEEAVDATPDDPVPGLVRRLAVQIAGETTVPDALAVVARTGDQALLWMFGDVVAELGDDPERIDASEKITWVEQLLPVSSDPIALQLDGADGDDGDFSVADGTVPAGSVRMVLSDLSHDAPAPRRRARPLEAEREPDVLVAEAEPAAPVGGPTDDDATFLPPKRPEAAPAPEAPVREASSERVAPPAGSSIVDLRDPDVDVRPPLPRGDGDTSPPPVVPDDAVARVRGVLCPVSHLNDPRARYCSSCGRAMLHTRHEAEGVRPPLGVLVLDDGRTFGLATDYVVGRHPEDDGEVAAGNKRSLALTDAAISAVHAEFALRDWDVEVIDRGSRNGTFVSEDDGETWQSLDADEPRTIRPGAQVSFAGRIVTFETSHRPGG